MLIGFILITDRLNKTEENNLQVASGTQFIMVRLANRRMNHLVELKEKISKNMHLDKTITTGVIKKGSS